MNHIKKELLKYANPLKAKLSSRYFKTGKGEYGEGDSFLGLTVPQSRIVMKKLWRRVSLEEIQNSLISKIHEERLVALLILIEKFENNDNKKEIYDFYMRNTKRINNWDLVDSSASYIVGEYLLDKNKKVLEILAQSKNLWEKRIAIIATLAFIRKGEIDETMKISKMLISDKHDLIHKAVGWMLREAWKMDPLRIECFLRSNYEELPRTTLRYAIEKMDDPTRKKWLKGEFS